MSQTLNASTLLAVPLAPLAGAVLAECRFTIATPQARYIHPRVGYAFAPPAGWTIDDSGPDDGVRLRAPDGAGLIEIQTGPASVPLDPVSYAAGWQSVAVGPGKRVEALRASRRILVDGRPAFEGVYAGANVLMKIVFVATADRMYVITGVFEASQFGAGQTLFDAWIASLRVSPASD